VFRQCYLARQSGVASDQGGSIGDDGRHVRRAMASIPRVWPRRECVLIQINWPIRCPNKLNSVMLERILQWLIDSPLWIMLFGGGLGFFCIRLVRRLHGDLGLKGDSATSMRRSELEGGASGGAGRERDE
jgi:hypothetical protein